MSVSKATAALALTHISPLRQAFYELHCAVGDDEVLGMFQEVPRWERALVDAGITVERLHWLFAAESMIEVVMPRPLFERLPVLQDRVYAKSTDPVGFAWRRRAAVTQRWYLHAVYRHEPDLLPQWTSMRPIRVVAAPAPELVR